MLAKLRAFLPALAWMGLIFFLSARESLPDLPLFPHADKVIHAGTYGMLALLLARGGARAGVGWPLWAWVVVAAAYGSTDELHQAWVPGRQPDVLDWSADVVGACVGVVIWRWVERRGVW